MSSDEPANPQEPQPTAPQTPTGMSKEEATWGMLCHLSALAMFILPSVGNILGPLILWLIKKDQYPFVDSQGKESLNFQISITIYAIACGLLSLLLIGIPLLIAVMVFWLVEVIMASVSANEGKPWTYPVTIRFIG